VLLNGTYRFENGSREGANLSVTVSGPLDEIVVHIRGSSHEQNEGIARFPAR
jgi:hypothetical protein